MPVLLELRDPVTFYYRPDFGGTGFARVECASLKIVEGAYAQYPDALEVTFVPRGKRSERQFHDSTRKVVVLRGWGHPDPDDAAWIELGGGPAVSTRKTKYLSADPAWERDFRAALRPYVVKHPGVLLADPAGLMVAEAPGYHGTLSADALANAADEVYAGIREHLLGQVPEARFYVDGQASVIKSNISMEFLRKQGSTPAATPPVEDEEDGRLIDNTVIPAPPMPGWRQAGRDPAFGTKYEGTLPYDETTGLGGLGTWEVTVTRAAMGVYVASISKYLLSFNGMSHFSSMAAAVKAMDAHLRVTAGPAYVYAPPEPAPAARRSGPRGLAPGRVPVRAITFSSSESDLFALAGLGRDEDRKHITVHSFEAADRIANAIARTKVGQGYAKTHVSVEWADGATDDLRFDIGDQEGGPNGLSDRYKRIASFLLDEPPTRFGPPKVGERVEGISGPGGGRSGTIIEVTGGAPQEGVRDPVARYKQLQAMAAPGSGASEGERQTALREMAKLGTPAAMADAANAALRGYPVRIRWDGGSEERHHIDKAELEKARNGIGIHFKVFGDAERMRRARSLPGYTEEADQYRERMAKYDFSRGHLSSEDWKPVYDMEQAADRMLRIQELRVAGDQAALEAYLLADVPPTLARSIRAACPHGWTLTRANYYPGIPEWIFGWVGRQPPVDEYMDREGYTHSSGGTPRSVVLVVRGDRYLVSGSGVPIGGEEAGGYRDQKQYTSLDAALVALAHLSRGWGVSAPYEFVMRSAEGEVVEKWLGSSHTEAGKTVSFGWYSVNAYVVPSKAGGFAVLIQFADKHNAKNIPFDGLPALMWLSEDRGEFKLHPVPEVDVDAWGPDAQTVFTPRGKGIQGPAAILGYPSMDAAMLSADNFLDPRAETATYDAKYHNRCLFPLGWIVPQPGDRVSALGGTGAATHGEVYKLQSRKGGLKYPEYHIDNLRVKITGEDGKTRPLDLSWHLVDDPLHAHIKAHRGTSKQVEEVEAPAPTLEPTSARPATPISGDPPAPYPPFHPAQVTLSTYGAQKKEGVSTVKFGDGYGLRQALEADGWRYHSGQGRTYLHMIPPGGRALGSRTISLPVAIPRQSDWRVWAQALHAAFSGPAKALLKVNPYGQPAVTGSVQIGATKIGWTYHAAYDRKSTSTLQTWGPGGKLIAGEPTTTVYHTDAELTLLVVGEQTGATWTDAGDVRWTYDDTPLAKAMAALDRKVAPEPERPAAPTAAPVSGAVVLIHNRTEGTVAKGDTRGVKDTLKRHGFQWYGAGGFWYIQRSRDQARPKIDLEDLAVQLRELGVAVKVEVTP